MRDMLSELEARREKAREGGGRILRNASDVRGCESRSIDDGQCPVTHHTNLILGIHFEGRVLVESEPKHGRIAQNRRDQTTDSIALTKVLINDDPRQDGESGRHAQRGEARGGTCFAPRDHDCAEGGGAGARAGEVQARGRHCTEQARRRRCPSSSPHRAPRTCLRRTIARRCRVWHACTR